MGEVNILLHRVRTVLRALGIETEASIPLVILILFIAITAPARGAFKMSGLWILVSGMTMYKIAVFSEVVRVGIISSHQDNVKQPRRWV